MLLFFLTSSYLHLSFLFIVEVIGFILVVFVFILLSFKMMVKFSNNNDNGIVCFATSWILVLHSISVVASNVDLFHTKLQKNA